MTLRFSTIAALSFAFAAPLAFAEPFAAASGGGTEWKSDCGGNVSCDTHGTMATFRLGYQLTPYVGVEARYANLGKLSADFPSGVFIVGDTTTQVFGSRELRGRAEGIDVIVTSPPWAGFTFGAIGGVAHTTGRARTSIPGFGSDEVSASGTKGYYGIRASYAVWSNIDASLEADRYRVAFPGGTGDVDTLAVGLTYRFR